MTLSHLSPHEKFYCLIGGVVAILVIASVLGAVMAARVQDERKRATVQNLNQRVRAWWGMVAVLGLGFFLGPWATLVIFALSSFFALREFISLTPTRLGDHRPLAIAFFVLIPVQYYLIGDHWYGLFAIFLPVYGFCVLAIFASMAEDTTHFLERCAKIQWGVLLCVFCISHAPALMMLDIPHYEGQGALLLFWMVAVVQLSDVLQYVCGKLIGKRKLSPLVSPSKTVEGLIGGGLLAITIGTALWWVTPFKPWQAALFSYLLVLCGFLGGYVLSATKRSLGAKDWGSMIEGHGGVLDRMDSLCFSAPIFFHLVKYFFT